MGDPPKVRALLRRRTAIYVAASVIAGGFWGAFTGAIFVPFVLEFAIAIGIVFGAACSPWPVTWLVRKPPDQVIPLWCLGVTIAWALTVPFDMFALTLAVTVAAYLASVYLVSFLVFDDPEIEDRRCCSNCGYSREGLPSRRCPECGTTFR